MDGPIRVLILIFYIVCLQGVFSAANKYYNRHRRDSDNYITYTVFEDNAEIINALDKNFNEFEKQHEKFDSMEISIQQLSNKIDNLENVFDAHISS